MSVRRHTVTRYEYVVDLANAGSAQLLLWGRADRRLATIHTLGLAENSRAAKPPHIAPDLSYAMVEVHPTALALMLDILQSDTPVMLQVDDQPPGYVNLCTEKQLGDPPAAKMSN